VVYPPLSLVFAVRLETLSPRDGREIAPSSSNSLQVTDRWHFRARYACRGHLHRRARRTVRDRQQRLPLWGHCCGVAHRAYMTEDAAGPPKVA